uniref:Taste receptor type 2 n=1 Tax=Latimeria chalumnae TaxID=7897 RepID=H3ABV1_LATCH
VMTTADLVPFLVAMVIIVFGCLGNSFIILVFLLEYKRSQTVQPYELIVILMAICGIVLELISILWFVAYLLNFCTYFGEMIYKVIDFLLILLPKSVIWLTAWLCFVYCVKIVKVNRRFYMRLKQRLSLAVNFMIAGTALLCISISIPSIFLIKFTTNSTNICRQYYTVKEEQVYSFVFGNMLSLLTSFLPLVLMVVSSLGIVVFLCQHSRNMDKNVTPTGTSHINAHTSVAIMLICLIVLFIACAGTVLSLNLQIAAGQLDVLLADSLTNIIYSGGSPVILIIGTVKLRKCLGQLCCP